MENKDLIKVFANRTLKNLRAIEKMKEKNARVYEVTQLINSMLGIMIFPRERDLTRIPNKSYDELRNEGWPAINTANQFTQVKDLDDLTRKFRNSIAHCNIEFLNHKKKIVGLRLWNMDRNRINKVWEADLTIQELHDITMRFIRLFLK